MRLPDFCRAALGLRGTLIAPSRLHLTCRFLGRFDAPQARLEEAAIEQANLIDAEPFQIRFEHATSFDGPKDAPCVFVSQERPPVLMELAERAGRDSGGLVHSCASAVHSARYLASQQGPDLRADGDCADHNGAHARCRWPCSTSGERDYRIVGTWPLGQ